MNSHRIVWTSVIVICLGFWTAVGFAVAQLFS